MPLDPEAMDAAVLRNLKAKTGHGPEAWHAALRAAGPFSKPAQAVAWLKAQGLGHVTAQILVRHAAPEAQGPTVDSVLGTGAPLFRALEAALAGDLPGLKVGMRKGYVTLATRAQFAVAVPARAGAGIWLGLVAQAEGAALRPAPPMGAAIAFGCFWSCRTKRASKPPSPICARRRIRASDRR
jgi:hypothetical protein